MLKKAEEHLSGQRAFEAEKTEKLENCKEDTSRRKGEARGCRGSFLLVASLHVGLILSFD